MIVRPLTLEYEEQARAVILEGFKERFGFIDHSYNPDLTSIVTTYTQRGSLFLVGLINGRVVCTGAFTGEGHCGRIQRMSVTKTYRRLGLAAQMLQTLEQYASEFGYEKLVLETNNDWDSAIRFYQQNGFKQYLDDGECVHFYKLL